MKLHFPTDFLWGTSSAAAQVETASAHSWRGVVARDGFVFNRTTDHELRRDEDLEYICSFGQVYRCGVDWARLQPHAFAEYDAEVVAEYQLFFEKLTARGMKLMLVLHHFTNPIWFENMGGFTKQENNAAFLNYTAQYIEHFGQYAYTFNTFNEPCVYAANGYVMGNFPPFKRNPFLANKVVKNMGEAHNAAFDLLKKAFPEKQVGISKNCALFKAVNIWGILPEKFANWWFNDYVMAHFEKVDFIGMSYYALIPLTPFPVTEMDNPGKLAKMGYKTDKMWAYHPEGLRYFIQRFYNRYKKPIWITENGVCTEDSQVRIGALKDYLTILHELIAEGVPIIGYTHWSTWDNFEWNLGCTFRFGLVTVDFETMNRTMTDAGRFYTKIASENAL
ncbi:MAG: hypothetical protein RI894_489 [Bacteroidota bacterium]|jgi:beta-glucosidase